MSIAFVGFSENKWSHVKNEHAAETEEFVNPLLRTNVNVLIVIAAEQIAALVAMACFRNRISQRCSHMAWITPELKSDENWK